MLADFMVGNSEESAGNEGCAGRLEACESRERAICKESEVGFVCEGKEAAGVVVWRMEALVCSREGCKQGNVAMEGEGGERVDSWLEACRCQEANYGHGGDEDRIQGRHVADAGVYYLLEWRISEDGVGYWPRGDAEEEAGQRQSSEGDMRLEG